MDNESPHRTTCTLPKAPPPMYIVPDMGEKHQSMREPQKPYHRFLHPDRSLRPEGAHFEGEGAGHRIVMVVDHFAGLLD
jgi:hypothetical protein